MILYGMSYLTMTFRINLEMDFDNEVTDEETKNSMKMFFQKFSGIAKYIKKQKRIVNKEGKVKNLIGKEFNLPDGMLDINSFGSKNEKYEAIKRKARAERQAVNYPIQGGASSIITIAMKDVRNYFMNSGDWFSNLTLINQVHDENSYLVKNEFSEKFYSIIKEKMENSLKLRVPLLVEGKITTNWALAK